MSEEEKRKLDREDDSDESEITSEEEEEEEEDDSEELSDESSSLSDVEIQKDDPPEVKDIKIKLLKEKSKVLDAKETIGALVDQITAYKVSVEEDKLLLETQLKQEKKTKLELYEIYKEMEATKDNLTKQLEIVILECEQLDREKHTISKENINNLQTLMNEITHIEETNSHLEKELEKEKDLHKQTQLNLQTEIQLVQKLEAYNKDLSSTFTASSPSLGFNGGGAEVVQLKKQLLDCQSQLAKEKEKLLNIDNLLFQARKIGGFAESNGGQLDQNSLFEISQLKNTIGEEKQLHHKTQLLLEEEKKKSELNKKTADNVVARMKELISSHHETLKLLDDEKENSSVLLQELQALKELLVKQGPSTQTQTQNTPLPSETGEQTSESNHEEGKLKQDPSSESISSQSSAGQTTSNTADLMNNAYISMKYGAKMYKTIRMKKSAATPSSNVSKTNTLGGDLSSMFSLPNPEKPTSPETNNIDGQKSVNNNNNNFTDIIDGSKKEISLEPNKFSSKNSLKFGGGVRFNDFSDASTATNNNDNRFISYNTSPSVSTSTTSTPTKDLDSKKSSKSSKLDKEKKEREKKLEKEKAAILKKISKDLKKKEKEKEKEEKEREKESSKKVTSNTTTPSNPDTPKEPSPISSKSNSVSSLRDSFENSSNTEGGSTGGSLNSKSELAYLANGGDKSPQLSSKDSIKDKRKSRFFS